MRNFSKFQRTSETFNGFQLISPSPDMISDGRGHMSCREGKRYHTLKITRWVWTRRGMNLEKGFSILRFEFVLVSVRCHLTKSILNTFNQLKIGDSSFPFTSTFVEKSIIGINPFPGRTNLSISNSSSGLSGSWLWN